VKIFFREPLGSAPPAGAETIPKGVPPVLKYLYVPGVRFSAEETGWSVKTERLPIACIVGLLPGYLFLPNAQTHRHGPPLTRQQQREMPQVWAVDHNMGESSLQQERVHHFPICPVHIGEETPVGILFLQVKFEPDLLIEDKASVVFPCGIGHKITLLTIMSDLGGIDSEISNPVSVFQKNCVPIEDKHGKTMLRIGWG